MFFKMLKNDLRAHKGLNIILFVFIISASVISVVAANLMYTEIAGRARTDKVSNIANVVVNVNIGSGRMAEKKQALTAWMDKSSMVDEGEIKEYIRLLDDNVCINGVYAWDDSFPYHNTFHLTTASSRVNLLYNDADKRFSVGSGCVAISMNISDMAGIKRGDEIRITTQLGTVYSFKVSEIYKTPFDADCEELILSDGDFEYLKDEIPFRNCKLLLRAGSLSYTGSIRDELYELDSEGKVVRALTTFEYSPELDQEYTVVVVISYFLAAMSVMIIIIMMIMIRYMMIAAIKREEKEIGMMRAIGVDSFRYRWMFAATYITFAFIGGIAGISLGVPLAGFVLKKFCKNIILRDPYIIQKTGLIVSVSIVLLIIIFAAVMMRRIQKISVVEALHGSNTGERFESVSRIDLYRSKKCRVPAFLAISDMINSFGRYSFLIISYMLAAVILLTVFNLKSTLLSPEYQKSFLQVERDFYFIFYDADVYDYYYQKGGDREGATKLFVEDMNKEGVPVSIRYMKGQAVTILREQKENIGATLWFGDTYNEDIPLREGKLPVYKNELIMSYYTAKKEGLKIGDRLNISLLEYDDDRIGTHETEREFIISGFMDMMEEGYPEMIAGAEYSGAYDPKFLLTNIHLDAPKSSHPAMIKELKEKFGGANIREPYEYTRNNFSYIVDTIDALKAVFTVVIALMLALNTMLYTTVDLVGETPAIAILKCVGFTGKDIRKWQLIRMLMIMTVAILLGYLAEYTIMNPVVTAVFETFGNTGKHFVPDLLENIVVIPGIILLIGTVVMRLCVIKIKGINLWNIRED